MTGREIRISRSAERQHGKLPRTDRARVGREMLALTDDPFPGGARKLFGHRDVFRIPVGPCRILYSVSETELIIAILKVGHCRDVYR
jgi:mRNA interferase RelE/StbE